MLRINHWLDSTSDPDAPRWIVSLDDDEADTTHTLRVMGARCTESGARRAAASERYQRAQRRRANERVYGSAAALDAQGD